MRQAFILPLAVACNIASCNDEMDTEPGRFLFVDRAHLECRRVLVVDLPVVILQESEHHDSPRANAFGLFRVTNAPPEIATLCRRLAV